MLHFSLDRPGSTVLDAQHLTVGFRTYDTFTESITILCEIIASTVRHF